MHFMDGWHMGGMGGMGAWWLVALAVVAGLVFFLVRALAQSSARTSGAPAGTSVAPVSAIARLRSAEVRPVDSSSRENFTPVEVAGLGATGFGAGAFAGALDVDGRGAGRSSSFFTMSVLRRNGGGKRAGNCRQTLQASPKWPGRVRLGAAIDFPEAA